MHEVHLVHLVHLVHTILRLPGSSDEVHTTLRLHERGDDSRIREFMTFSTNAGVIGGIGGGPRASTTAGVYPRSRLLWWTPECSTGAR